MPMSSPRPRPLRGQGWLYDLHPTQPTTMSTERPAGLRRMPLSLELDFGAHRPCRRSSGGNSTRQPPPRPISALGKALQTFEALMPTPAQGTDHREPHRGHSTSPSRHRDKGTGWCVCTQARPSINHHLRPGSSTAPSFAVPRDSLGDPQCPPAPYSHGLLCAHLLNLPHGDCNQRLTWTTLSPGDTG